MTSQADRPPPDPLPDNGHYVTLGADHPSLPDPQPDGGRGEFWNYPPTAKRCKKHNVTRTHAAREQGLLGPDEWRRCRRPSTKDQDACRWHGGVVKKGEHGRPIINGRYAKRLGGLREAYIDSREDQALFDLREPAAVLDAVVQRTMERLQELDTPDFRQEALRFLGEYQSAKGEGNETGAKAAIERLSELLHRGASEDAALADVTEVVVTFQKRIEKAWDIKLHRDETMNITDLKGVLGYLYGITIAACGDVINEDGEPVKGIIDRGWDEFFTGIGSNLSGVNAIGNGKPKRKKAK